MSSSSKGHSKSLSNSSRNSKLNSSSSSQSDSQVNEEEEDEHDSNNSNPNSTSDQFVDEDLLQKIESMPSLDSEFLMSPHLEFPSFSKKEASQASNDMQNLYSKDGTNSENSFGSDPNHFPSIMPDELPSLDSQINESNNQNNDDESNGSFSHSNVVSHEISTDQINQNTEKRNIKTNNSQNTPKNDASSRKTTRATFTLINDKKRISALVKKSSFPRFSRDTYTYDFENDDDDGDPSSALPMPMQMAGSSDQTMSHSKRRQTLPLKRSSLTENERQSIQKMNSSTKLKFLGFEGMNKCEQTLLKTCHNCSERIEKDGAFINGWYYHKKCLTCAKCGKHLDLQNKCFMYHEQLMCEACVHFDMSTIKTCQICGQKIYNSSEEVELPSKQKVHSTCLNCYMCGASLTLDQAITVDDESAVLPAEAEDDENPLNSKQEKKKSKSKPKAKKKKPKTCNGRKTSNFSCDSLIDDFGGIRLTKFVCKNCHSRLMKEQICCACNRPVLANIVVKNQRVFHRQCFRCERPGCGTQLFGNSYVVHHNRFLCWRHGKIYASSCSYCKQVFKSFETDRIKWHSKLYHKSCFVCRVCGIQVDPQVCRSVHGRPHCDQCFQIRVREGDCDERGRSLYVHYSQMNRPKKRGITKDASDSNEEERENEVDPISNSSSSTVNGDDVGASVDLSENNRLKHQTHLHFAKAAEKRKNRFFVKYHVNVNWPEYCEKVFEKAQPYRPEEEKNVFKKF